ncbi:MAG: ankyrin repeat protein [Schlesneria sp.]|nr:ankyrin repeat protein [Schlesneria sp.]
MQIHDYAAQGDLTGVRRELQSGIHVDARDEQDYTPLACAATSPQAGVEMLQLLITSGAEVNLAVNEQRHFPLELVACSGDVTKVQFLLDAGADINNVSRKGHTVLFKIMYALEDDENLLSVADLLVKNGAQIDSETEYGESPLSMASIQGRFDAVRYLLDAGANSSLLKWTPLMMAVAMGSSKDVFLLLNDGAAIDGEDRFSRTPFQIAVQVGDVRKAALLHEYGCRVDHSGQNRETALTIAAANGHIEMMRWLIEHGADIEAVNGMNSTALMIAAQGGQTACVELLLEAGAVPNRKNKFDESAKSMAANEQIVRLLTKAGEDFADISAEMKRLLIGHSTGGSINVSPAEYRAGRERRFGRSNPEVMNVPFWHEMVRAGVNAYQARKKFDDTDLLTRPVWCFDRYGMSFTELPDGRFVQIGGEHEDYYDPDFCIYNEVVVHERSVRDHGVPGRRVSAHGLLEAKKSRSSFACDAVHLC